MPLVGNQWGLTSGRQRQKSILNASAHGSRPFRWRSSAPAFVRCPVQPVLPAGRALHCRLGTFPATASLVPSSLTLSVKRNVTSTFGHTDVPAVSITASGPPMKPCCLRKAPKTDMLAGIDQQRRAGLLSYRNGYHVQLRVEGRDVPVFEFDAWNQSIGSLENELDWPRILRGV